MADWPAILTELHAIRTRLDQIAAVVTGHQARDELMPIWDCGHKHQTRGEAVRCRRGQEADVIAEGVTSTLIADFQIPPTMRDPSLECQCASCRNARLEAKVNAIAASVGRGAG